MIWYNRSRRWLSTPQDNVAATLTADDESNPFERLHAFRS
jgi:hypothetical protein